MSITLLTKKLLLLVKNRKPKPFSVRICEEVFQGHIALKCSLLKRGIYFNDPDIYTVRCLVCSYQQLMNKEEAKAFLRKCIKGENPDIKKYGIEG